MIGKRILWTLAILLIAAMAAAAIYTVWPLLHPKIVRVAPLDPTCDLHRGSCVGVFPGGERVFLSIEPRSLPVMQPLAIEVRTEGLRADVVEVDFAGVNMDMGLNRPQLRGLSDHRFLGETMLPVCVRPRMAWEARVLVHSDRGLLAAPFRFATTPPGTARP